MPDETALPTEETADRDFESTPLEIEGEIGETAPDAAETLEMISVDYTPVIYEVGNGVASTIIWCTFLIVGVLIAFKILEVKH